MLEVNNELTDQSVDGNRIVVVLESDSAEEINSLDAMPVAIKAAAARGLHMPVASFGARPYPINAITGEEITEGPVPAGVKIKYRISYEFYPRQF